MLVMMVMTADYGGGDIMAKTRVLVYMAVLGQALQTHYLIYSMQGHFPGSFHFWHHLYFHK